MAEQFIKALRLITPEGAQQESIPGTEGAESPVLVSTQPLLRRNCRITDCDVTIAPLPYFQGRETKAQHFHAREGSKGMQGGIYFDKFPFIHMRRHRQDGIYFFADVQPVGRLEEVDATTGTWRAEGVMVGAVSAFTETPLTPDTPITVVKGVPKAERTYVPITEGILVRQLPGSEYLIPVTDESAQHYAENRRYCRFRISDKGRLSFSQISNETP